MTTPTAETIVYTDEPGRILPILEREFDDFDTEVTRFLDGQIEEPQFIGFRLKQGVYGQRQPSVNMVRCKLPLGTVASDQLDAFGEVAERFAPLRKGHITTRQNIQVHHIPLPRMREVLRVLGKAGISSREACGNTVRNVTGDPWAGVSPDELFDPTPYAAAFARWWLRNPLSQLLPRKFKVAFSADHHDRAITAIHDLGFIPRIENGVKGFQIWTGGGTSIMPRHGYVLRDFADESEYLKVSEAVVRIFERADELRKNRAKARIKFLIDRVGIEAFRKMVDDEISTNEGGWADKDFRPGKRLFLHDEARSIAPKRATYAQPGENGDRRAYTAFVTTNVRAQKQSGFNTVQVKVPRGDLRPEQFHGLADIVRDYCSGHARMSVQQNIVLRWVRDEALYEVYQKLLAIDLADAGAETATDVVSCPGTDSCKLGITSSMGLNAAIEAKVASLNIPLEDTLLQSVHIKMSGCPNGCGQHHIANIGFHGAALKVGDQQLPAYHVFIGGQYEGGVRMGQQLKLRLPAKRGPEAAERLLRLYERERQPGEAFNAYFDRVGPKPFEEAILDLCPPGDFSDDNKSMFIDWGKLDLYQLQRGEGECAV